MGSFANGALTRVTASAAAAIVLILNSVLLYQTFLGA
jgi:Mn2+/Fe2+ NRAMP family transporter